MLFSFKFVVPLLQLNRLFCVLNPCFTEVQRTYNITLWHIDATNTAVEINQYYIRECVRSHTYPNMKCACVILSTAACLALLYFSTLSHKWHNVQKKHYWTYNVCFDISPQLLSETFLILGRTEQEMKKNVYWSSCKVPIILVRLLWNLNFLNRFSKDAQTSNVKKIRPVGAE
jgi:hypothetical protein